MTPEWYYAKGKQKLGPFSFPELQQLARAGKIEPNDLVLRAGTSTWVPASSLQTLYPVATFFNPSSGQTADPTAIVNPKARETARRAAAPAFGWRLLSEVWLIPLIAWRQSSRLLRYTYDTVRLASLRRSALRAQLALGQRVLHSGMGDAQVCSQIDQLDAANTYQSGSAEQRRMRAQLLQELGAIAVLNGSIPADCAADSLRCRDAMFRATSLSALVEEQRVQLCQER